MVFKSGEALRTIAEGLGWIVHTCKLQGILKLFDNHIQAQRFFCRLLNAAYGLQLKQMDQIQANHPAIDLGDSANRIAYQVSAEKGGDKVQHTLNKFIEHGLQQQYDVLKILVFDERQGSYGKVVVPAQIKFNCDSDIIGIRELLKHIETLATPRLGELVSILNEELKSPTLLPNGLGEIPKRVEFSQPVLPGLSLAEHATRAIEGNRSDARVRVERYMREFVNTLNSMNPDLERGDEDKIDEFLVKAIDDTIPHMFRFGELVNTVTLSGLEGAGLGLWHGLASLLEGYDLPLTDTSGRFRSIAFDFHKFMGHECCLIVVASLMQHHQWGMLASLLSEDLSVQNARSENNTTLVPISYAQDNVGLLNFRSRKRNLNTLSLHSDILYERHTNSPLAELASFENIRGADLLLALRFIGPSPFRQTRFTWEPLTVIRGGRTPPHFLQETIKESKGVRLGAALGFSGNPKAIVQQIKAAFVTTKQFAHTKWGFYGDLRCLEFDSNLIGSKP